MTAGRNSLSRIVLFALMALAASFTVFSVTAFASRQKTHRDLDNLLKRYQVNENAEDGQDNGDPDAADGQEKPKPPHHAQAERINGRHFFSQPKPEPQFSAKLQGVLGRQAYFEGDGKAYEVGQTFRGAKLTEVGPDWVTLDFKGEIKTLYVFGKGGAASRPYKAPPTKALPLPTQPRQITLPDMPGMPNLPKNIQIPQGFKLTPAMIAYFKSLPPEKQEELLKLAPDDIKEQLAD